MPILESEDKLLPHAIAGDQQALEQLLVACFDELTRYLERKVPSDLGRVVQADDILQQTYCQAFRDIGRFQARAPGAFYHWLRSIADNRLLDAVRTERRQKRGGGWKRLSATGGRESRRSFLQMLSAEVRTPSSLAAGREAERALNVALAGLSEEYRTVIQLRHLQGLSIEQVATEMKRSADVIRGLLYRARKKLREALERPSLWMNG